MKRDTRDKFVSATNQDDPEGGNSRWETPPAVFARLNEQYGPFDVDLTADASNHLCEKWFGPGSPIAIDCFDVNWADHGHIGYSNPVYGPFVQRILPHAKHYANAYNFTSVFLLPVRITKAFHEHVLRGADELRFCDRRITFFERGAPRLNKKAFTEGRVQADPALFDSMIVVYREGVSDDSSPIVSAWEVPDHVAKIDLDRAAEALRGR